MNFLGQADSRIIEVFRLCHNTTVHSLRDARPRVVDSVIGNTILREVVGADFFTTIA